MSCQTPSQNAVEQTVPSNMLADQLARDENPKKEENLDSRIIRRVVNKVYV